VFLSSDNDNQEEIKDQDGDNERKMKDFEENDFLTSIMFSMKTPRAIVEALKVELKKKKAEPELHATKWKLTYTIKIELTDREKEWVTDPESCRVQVKIFNIPQENNKKAVEFIRLSGSSRFFYEHFS
jgi:fibronectin type 3 domain-containing protein